MSLIQKCPNLIRGGGSTIMVSLTVRWLIESFGKMTISRWTGEGNKCCVSSLRVILWPPPGLPTNYHPPPHITLLFSIPNSTANKAVSSSDFAFASRINFDTKFLFQLNFVLSFRFVQLWLHFLQELTN